MILKTMKLLWILMNLPSCWFGPKDLLQNNTVKTRKFLPVLKERSVVPYVFYQWDLEKYANCFHYFICIIIIKIFYR